MAWSSRQWNNLTRLAWSTAGRWTLPNAGMSTQVQLSVVNGTAFLNILDVDLTPYIGKQITLTDTAGVDLVGWLKASGTGETLDVEVFDNPGFSADANWTKQTGWTIPTPVATSAGANAGLSIFESKTPTNGALYKVSVDITAFTSGVLTLLFDGASAGDLGSAVGTFTSYKTSSFGVAKNFGFVAKAPTVAFKGSIDNASLKKVLTPQVIGATVVSTQGGSTFNWTSEGGGFNRKSTNYKWSIAL